jgi:hypothetical protein
MRRYAEFGAVLSLVVGVFLGLRAVDRPYAISLLRQLGPSWSLLPGIAVAALGASFFVWQYFARPKNNKGATR